MPFTPLTKNPGDLVKSQDWNALEQAISELFKKFALVGGHRHTGTDEDAPKITAEGLSKDAITPEKIQNGAVTAAKLQSDPNDNAKRAVGTAHIQDGSVSIAKAKQTIIASGTTSINPGQEIEITVQQITETENLPEHAFYWVSIAHYYNSIFVINGPNYDFSWSEGIKTRSIISGGPITLISRINYRVIKVKSQSSVAADIHYKVYQFLES